MGATSQQADEYAPAAPLTFDPEANTWGKQAGVTEGMMGGESDAVLPGHYVGRKDDILFALLSGSAPAAFYLDHEPASKYADDLIGLLGPQLTPQPVAGAEQYINQLNEQASQQFNTKEPKTRASDQPSSSAIQANLAASPADLLPSSQDAMMSLIFGV